MALAAVAIFAGELGTLAQLGLTVAASAFDSLVTIPTLFPADDIDGDRIQDIALPQSQEGAPVPLYFGQARCEAYRAYESTERLIPQVQSVGGKNGPDVTTWLREIDLLAVFAEDEAERALDLGKTGRPTEVYFDNQIVYADQAVFSVNVDNAWSTQILDGSGVLSPNFHQLTIIDPTLDFSEFVPGFAVETVGFPSAGNNISPVGGNTQDGAQVYSAEEGFLIIRLYFNPAIATPPNPFVVEAGVGGVVITQTINDFQDDAFESIEFAPYDLDPYSAASPSFAALTSYAATKGGLGPTQVPGLGNSAAVMITGLNKTKFGGRTPLVHAVFEDSQVLGSNYYLDLLERAGIPQSRVEFESVVGSGGLGFTRRGQRPMMETFGASLLAANAQAVEVGGKIKFRRRGSAPVIEIPEGDFGAKDLGDNQALVSLRFTDAPSLINECSVEFTDNETFQTESEPAQAPFPVGKAERLNLRQLTLSRESGRGIAYRALGDSFGNPFSATFPPQYGFLQQGYRIKSTINGVQIEGEIVRRKRERGTGRMICDVMPGSLESYSFTPPTQN